MLINRNQQLEEQHLLSKLQMLQRSGSPVWRRQAEDGENKPYFRLCRARGPAAMGFIHPRSQLPACRPPLPATPRTPPAAPLPAPAPAMVATQLRPSHLC